MRRTELSLPPCSLGETGGNEAQRARCSSLKKERMLRRLVPILWENPVETGKNEGGLMLLIPSFSARFSQLLLVYSCSLLPGLGLILPKVGRSEVRTELFRLKVEKQ